ncbi:hypothetical protein V8E52_000119 [Russula decolorans]
MSSVLTVYLSLDRALLTTEAVFYSSQLSHNANHTIEIVDRFYKSWCSVSSVRLYSSTFPRPASPRLSEVMLGFGRGWSS